MPKNTPKYSRKPIMEMGGMFAAAALGFLEPGESVQPILLDVVSIEEITNEHNAARRQIYRITPLAKASQKRGNRLYYARRNKSYGDSKFTTRQWKEMKARYGHHCAYCGRRVTRLEIEHIVPLCQGGKHEADNIVPACRRCNAKKNGRTPEQAGMTIKHRW